MPGTVLSPFHFILPHDLQGRYCYYPADENTETRGIEHVVNISQIESDGAIIQMQGQLAPKSMLLVFHYAEEMSDFLRSVGGGGRTWL